MKHKERYTLYKLASDFAPDYTPEELREMGVYDQVYGDAESEASMKKWPDHWVHPQDPLGWLQWYERYHGGRRTDDDDRQKKRWNSFKGRHGSQYSSNPTDRRKAALRNWAIAADKLKKQASTTDRADLWDEDSGEFYPVHVPNIWEQVAGRDSEEIDIDKIWGGLETSPGFSEDRVDASDPNYPIILDDYTEGEGFYGGLVDGRHRRIKMKRDGKTRASVIKLTPEDIRELIDRQKEEAAAKGINKEEIIRQLAELNHSGVGVAGGAAMVLRGLRDDTSDIDADADSDVFNELHAKHGSPETEVTDMGTRMYNVPGTHIDLHESSPSGEPMDGVVGSVSTPEELLAFYEKLNRPKDQQWIQALRRI